ncbi:MAG: hypothetical protein IJ341_12560 [Bacteroidales bacterium]|nr:hypothetical protein [Bacteroidales bacterium]
MKFLIQLQNGGNTAQTKIDGTLDTLLKNLLTNEANELIKKNNLNRSSVLAPYKYLYITKETGKEYVFPLASQSASFSSLSNSWSNSDLLPAPLQKAADGLFSLMEAGSKVSNFASNITDFLKGGGDTGNNREMAKSYVYPQNGDSINVSFTLYNTTKLNAWKENYKFLFLFYMRNLPMRTDFASYVPPLLYDVIIPGVKQLPVCGVETLNIIPKGMTRVLTCENFIAGDDKNASSLAVNVPEAWEVNIRFKSLIGSSMNLMIEGVYGGHKITTETSDEV